MMGIQIILRVVGTQWGICMKTGVIIPDSVWSGILSDHPIACRRHLHETGQGHSGNYFEGHVVEGEQGGLEDVVLMEKTEQDTHLIVWYWNPFSGPLGNRTSLTFFWKSTSLCVVWGAELSTSNWGRKNHLHISFRKTSQGIRKRHELSAETLGHASDPKKGILYLVHAKVSKIVKCWVIHWERDVDRTWNKVKEMEPNDPLDREMQEVFESECSEVKKEVGIICILEVLVLSPIDQGDFYKQNPGGQKRNLQEQWCLGIGLLVWLDYLRFSHPHL